MSKKFRSLNEFYPFYLTEHMDKTCRGFHFIGTSLVIVLFIAGLITGSWWYFALLPVAGYGFAWIGHFAFEKNRPAAFQYPLYSLASDFIMYWHTITLQLPEKLESAKRIKN